MSSTIERLPSRPATPAPPVVPTLPTPPDLSDWAEAGFPVMDTVPETHGVHVEERLTDGTYVLRAELPGMDSAEDIEVTVTERFLTVRAERGARTAAGKSGTAIRYGHCTPLPAGAKGGEATAEYHRGVLTVVMPVAAT
ncbi:Hsp20/alpha crystallin family protein [Streptomyces sp. NPDC003247]|uniref:Hsp20/alpha crystallin family protein n=1 Tax=Streptomyces sp. NPDC003247 TaxID=3364677 RepID=UPI00368E2452